MSAGWRAQAAMIGRMPPAQASLAPVGMALGGLAAGGLCAGLAGSERAASAGLVSVLGAAFVRAALRRVVCPEPSGRAESRLGAQPLPLLPLTPAERFWGEFAGNLSASAGWVAAGLCVALIILLGGGVAITAGLVGALAAWVFGSLPVAGPRAWVGVLASIAVLLPLLPAAIAGVEGSEAPAFAVLVLFTALVWLGPVFIWRERLAAPTRSSTAANTAASKRTTRWLERAARLDVRAGESAEARLGRLIRPEMGRQVLTAVGWAVVYCWIPTSVRDDPLLTTSIQVAFTVWLGASAQSLAGDLARLLLGPAASRTRPALDFGFLLPLDVVRRRRLAARAVLGLGMFVALLGLATLALTGSPASGYGFAVSIWLTAPFDVVEQVRAGQSAPMLGRTATGIASWLGLMLLAVGIQFPGPFTLGVGGLVVMFVWLPMVVRSARLALA